MKAKLTKLFTLLAVLTLGISNVWAADFTAQQIIDGASSGNVSVSSAIATSTSSQKVCNVNTTTVSIDGSANGNGNTKYIQIQADEGYTLSSLAIDASINKTDGATYKIGVVFFSGGYTTTVTDKTEVVIANKNATSGCGPFDISLPSGTRTVRIYRAIKINGDNQFNGSGTQYGSAQNTYVASISATAASAVVTKHTVTYELNGGTGTTPTQADVAEGAKFTLHDGVTGITAPTNKDFDGWHDGTTKYAGGAEYTMGTSNVTLTAQWKDHVANYTVIYKDGTTELGSETVEVGQHPTGSEIATPTKDCYTFAGWDPALSGVSGSDGDEIVVNATWNPVYAFGNYIFEGTAVTTSKTAPTVFSGAIYFSAVDATLDTGNPSYYGWKLKTSGATVKFLVENDCTVKITLKEANPLNVTFTPVTGVETTEVAAKSETKTINVKSGTVVTLTTTTASTTTLNKIEISATATGEDDATLSDLSVSGYTLNPSFDSATEDYTITKEYGAADPVVGDVTATPSVTGADADIAWDGTNHKFVITVTAKDGVTEKIYNVTVNEAEAKRGLLTVPFSNGAKGAINAAGLEIRVPYIGASEPTVVLANIEYQSGVSGASASMESDKLRITGADSNYDDYTLTFVQLTPSALTLDEEVTFDAVPSYAFAPYGWDSGKGVKFAKNVEDGTPRISSGNTRVYFAIQACDEVQLTSGSGGARDVKIYVNGVLSSVTKTAASGSAIKLALDNMQPNFIAIESNQTGGDGGFTKILVKALAANTLAYDNGAYTTGDPALDLSTLISTSNSDAAITYTVTTDGGTNATITGNNFTATATGTAVITATQAASETVRQASVDFNVVVSAGLAKYIVTYYDDATELGTEEVTEGEHPTATGIVTKKQGFNFLGWSETNGGAVVDLNGITISAAKNLYAKYEAIDCPTSGTIFLLNMNKTVSAAVDVKNGSVDLDEYATISGGSATLANTSNNTRAQVTTTPSIRLSNGDQGYVQIELDCPVLEGDIIRYINTSSGTIGVRTAHGTATNETVLQGSKTEITTVEVDAALDGLYTIYLDRKSNTSDLRYFEIYRRPVLTAVALNDFTMRKGAKRTPELILTPEDGLLESQAWSITASTPSDIASIDAATGEITASEEGEITVQVKVNDNDALVATCTVTIVGAIAQQDVTKSTVWDWHNTGATANIQLTGSTDPKKNEQFVLANVDVDNDEDFESDKLVVEGEYMVRDYDKANPYFQGQLIKFNTTVAGIIRVKFSNTGGNPARELYINGVGTGNTSANATLGWSDYVEVPVGEVSITAYLVDKSGDAEQKYIRVSEIEFFALGHSRSVTAGNLGTLCLPNDFIARGVDVYSLVGKEAEYGKIVFEDLEPDELLVAGQAYIFQANDATARFYYAPGEPVAEPLNNTALKGNLGSTITFQPNSPEAENVYFVKDHALWSAKETGVNIGQYRAYLQMDAVSELANPNPAPGRRYIMLGTNGQNQAQGIDDVQDDVRSTKMLIDGRLFILRGEKLYDATGRLVK